MLGVQKHYIIIIIYYIIYIILYIIIIYCVLVKYMSLNFEFMLFPGF